MLGAAVRRLLWVNGLFALANGLSGLFTGVYLWRLRPGLVLGERAGNHLAALGMFMGVATASQALAGHVLLGLHVRSPREPYRLFAVLPGSHRDWHRLLVAYGILGLREGIFTFAINLLVYLSGLSGRRDEGVARLRGLPLWCRGIRR